MAYCWLDSRTFVHTLYMLSVHTSPAYPWHQSPPYAYIWLIAEWNTLDVHLYRYWTVSMTEYTFERRCWIISFFLIAKGQANLEDRPSSLLLVSMMIYVYPWWVLYSTTDYKRFTQLKQEARILRKYWLDNRGQAVNVKDVGRSMHHRTDHQQAPSM